MTMGINHNEEEDESGADFLRSLNSEEVSPELVEEAASFLKTAERELDANGTEISTPNLLRYFRTISVGKSFQGQSIRKLSDDYFETYYVERENERAGKVNDTYLGIEAGGHYIWFAQEGKKLVLTIAKVPGHSGWRSR